MKEEKLPYSKLIAWKVGLELAAEAQRLADQLPRGSGPLADQMRRAAMSVCLNIAEGASRTSAKDKAQRFTIARAECAEVAAAVEVGVAMGSLPSGAGERAVGLAVRCGGLLTGLIRRQRRS